MSFLLDKHQQMIRCNTLQYILFELIYSAVYSDITTNEQRLMKKDKHDMVCTQSKFQRPELIRFKTIMKFMQYLLLNITSVYKANVWISFSHYDAVN